MDHFLRSLDLQPINFDELAADMGAEFVGNIVREGIRRAHGIIAFFTPDEFAALSPDLRGGADTSEAGRWQARPNVIFEAGIALGVAPKRTILVTLGPQTELFSDIAGLHFVRLSNTVESRGRLRQKLIGAGCQVNTRTDGWTNPAASGDFDACLNGAPAGVRAPRDPF